MQDRTAQLTFYGLKHKKEEHIQIDPNGVPYVFGTKSVADVWSESGYEVVKLKISIIKE